MLQVSFFMNSYCLLIAVCSVSNGKSNECGQIRRRLIEKMILHRENECAQMRVLSITEKKISAIVQCEVLNVAKIKVPGINGKSSEST